MLASDGVFYGFKEKPNKYSNQKMEFSDLPEPLNNFTVQSKVVYYKV